MTRVLRLIGCAAVFAGYPAAQTPDVSVKAVTAATAAYLADYERQLSFLLADEQYTQTRLDSAGREIGRRTMAGESFVTFLPAHHAWISVRDITEVDGQRIDDHEDLRAMLEDAGVSDVARQLAQRNARYNIGSVTRNFNEPTLGLLVVGPQHRAQFGFDRKLVDRRDGVTLVTLAFKEKDSPTLVHGDDGRPVFATGELVIEAGTGRIRRTALQFRHGPVTAQLATDYEREPKLDIWVPVRFTERYEQTRKGLREVIVCEATYSNYRRFDVRVRIR